MEANNDDIALPSGPRPVRNELREVLSAFEQVTGLWVCFRTMSSRWRDVDDLDVAAEFATHRSPFCSKIKSRSLPACMKCDHVDLPSACWPARGRVLEPFTRTCHAGADEILLPLWDGGVLVAVLFAGQYTSGDPRGKAVHLRRIGDAEEQYLRTLTLALQAYLLDILRKLDDQRRVQHTGRSGLIEAYLQESLAAGPSLAELAVRLSLSRSRASHVVREATGRSFQDLVNERRLTLAKDLLAGSDGTIAWVAQQVGFNDVAYFCRYFRRKTGKTPTTFRRQHRVTVSA